MKTITTTLIITMGICFSFALVANQKLDFTPFSVGEIRFYRFIDPDMNVTCFVERSSKNFQCLKN